MPGRLPMNIVRAIVEHLDRHASYSEINRATGASKGFISKVAAAVEAASLTPEKFMLLNDEDIQNRITLGRPKRQLEPDWALIAGQMHSNRHLTLQLMWEATDSRPATQHIPTRPSAGFTPAGAKTTHLRKGTLTLYTRQLT